MNQKDATKWVLRKLPGMEFKKILISQHDHFSGVNVSSNLNDTYKQMIIGKMLMPSNLSKTIFCLKSMLKKDRDSSKIFVEDDTKSADIFRYISFLYVTDRFGEMESMIEQFRERLKKEKDFKTKNVEDTSVKIIGHMGASDRLNSKRDLNSQKQIKELINRAENLQSELLDFRKQLKKLQNEKESQKKQISDLQDERKQQNKLVNEQKDRIRSLVGKEAEKDKYLQKIRKKNRLLADKLKEKEEEVKKLSKKNDELELEIESKAVRLAAFTPKMLNPSSDIGIEEEKPKGSSENNTDILLKKDKQDIVQEKRLQIGAPRSRSLDKLLSFEHLDVFVPAIMDDIGLKGFYKFNNINDIEGKTGCKFNDYDVVSVFKPGLRPADIYSIKHKEINHLVIQNDLKDFWRNLK